MTRRSGGAEALAEQPGSCPPRVAFAVALVAAAIQDLGRPDVLKTADRPVRTHSRPPRTGQVIHRRCRPAGGPGEAAGPVLPYRLGMPARKGPSPQDAATAR